MKTTTFAQRALEFNERLSRETFDLPKGYSFINPFTGKQTETVRKITAAFYQKYYNDNKSRRMILGSSPARRGSAVTGVPFEDAARLQAETRIFIDKFCINNLSTEFLDEVIEKYGGRKKFYSDFYMSFVCPLGIARTNEKGRVINCNYYENSKLCEALREFIISTLKIRINLGIDTSVCYCVGSGENFKFLSRINGEHNFFDRLIPLEHPRYIMQYNSKRRNEYIEKYIREIHTCFMLRRDGR